MYLLLVPSILILAILTAQLLSYLKPITKPNFYHKNINFFPFKDKLNHQQHRIRFNFNVLPRIVFGLNFNVSFWYIDINLEFLIFNIQLLFIYNKKIIQK